MLKLKNTCTIYPNVTQLLEVRVYARRRDLKISQDRLADRTGLTRNCIQQMECHEHLPKLLTLPRLLLALGFNRKTFGLFMMDFWDAYIQDLVLLDEQFEALVSVSS